MQELTTGSFGSCVRESSTLHWQKPCEDPLFHSSPLSLTGGARFVDTENWRKEFNVDDIVATFEYTEKPQVFEYYPQYYHKTDKDGRPVYIEQLGKIDLTAMYKITTQERMLQNLVLEYERLADPRLPACSRKAEKLLETCCTIMDLKGVGITSISSVYGFVKQVSAISQNYYPERYSLSLSFFPRLFHLG